MGMFDDLVPKTLESKAPSSSSNYDVPDAYMTEPKSAPSEGLFSDLIPKREPIDFTRPDEDIRQRINALPEDERTKAHDLWADYRVQKLGLPNLPNPARGIPVLGRLADEVVGGSNAALYAISGGKLGQPYEEGVAEERARARAEHKKYPALAPVAEIAGGITAGGPIFSKFMTATSLPGQIAQSGTIGGIIGWLEGLASEGSAQDRVTRAAKEGTYGVALGAAAPPIFSGVAKGVESTAEAMSPLLARFGARARDLREKLAIKASADGAPGVAGSAGANAAAEQIIANQLARSNVSVPELRRRFQSAEDAARLDANSRAQNVLAPVDIDPSLQRLAGAVARQQPEADTLGKAFQYSRQSGLPSGLPLPEEAMIPTRPALAKPQPSEPPMGQSERVLDALKRALNIQDAQLHGHGKSAFATDKLIMQRAREQANDLYGQAYRLAEGVDIRPQIEPVLQKWTQIAAEEPQAVGHAIRNFLRQFTTKEGPVGDLRRFQKAKEFGDGIIRKWYESPEGRNRYVAGRLDEIQKDLLGAIDDIKIKDIGSAYRAARDAFAGEMQLRDALKLGRDMLRDDSDVVIDQFRNLATEGERKLFRLGLWEGAKQIMARKSRTDDITRIFTNPRIQEILSEVIPRAKGTRGQPAVFANRPERFGEYLSNEQRMIQTRNQTLGNSKTAERLADDEALDSMQSFIEAAKKTAQNPSVAGIVLRTLETALSKVFGFRADTATAIARMLYTANPMERERLLAAIELRMEPGRAAQFARVVNEISRGVPAQPIASGAMRERSEGP